MHSSATNNPAAGIGAAAELSGAPTAPTERELAILHRVLATTTVDGAAQLRDQLRMLHVAPSSDATMRIYLVHPDAPRAAVSRDARAKVITVPVRAVHGHRIGEVSIWVGHGHLCALQYVPYDGRPSLTLPDPALLDLPTDAPEPPIEVCVRGARAALLGVRVLRHADLPQVGAFATPARFHPGRVATIALALLVLTLAAIAFAIGSSGARPDLDAARSAGAAAGTRDATTNGDIAGTFAGSTEGALAGRASTYQASYDRAHARTIALARRAALKRRQAAEAKAAAAAAAAAPVYANNTTCSGYRDSNGYWVCS
jgi:hypothetical protein